MAENKAFNSALVIGDTVISTYTGFHFNFDKYYGL